MSEPDKTDRWSNLPGIIAALIVSILIGLGIAAWNYTQMQRASAEWTALMKGGVPFALSWLEDIRAGRLTQAHDATTLEARARVDRAAFDQFVADHTALKAEPVVKTYSTLGGTIGWSLGLGGIRNVDKPARFVLTATLRLPEDAEASEIEIVAIKDRTSGRLLVDQFKMLPVPSAKP